MWELRQLPIWLHSNNYLGHNCTGHNCIGHNYMGHNHKGHNYTDRAATRGSSRAMWSREKKEIRARRRPWPR